MYLLLDQITDVGEWLERANLSCSGIAEAFDNEGPTPTVALGEKSADLAGTRIALALLLNRPDLGKRWFKKLEQELEKGPPFMGSKRAMWVERLRTALDIYTFVVGSGERGEVVEGGEADERLYPRPKPGSIVLFRRDREVHKSDREPIKDKGVEDDVGEQGTESPAIAAEEQGADESDRSEADKPVQPPQVDFPNPSAPHTLTNIAEAWGGDMTPKKLRGLIDSGLIRIKGINRQTFIVCLDDIFNPTVRKKLAPPGYRLP